MFCLNEENCAVHNYYNVGEGLVDQVVHYRYFYGAKGAPGVVVGGGTHARAHTYMI